MLNDNPESEVVVVCTEVVDNSAMFVSQSLDGKLVKGITADPGDDSEVTSLLSDGDNKIIFYGLVKLPEWFTDEHYDQERMFNDPRKCKEFLNRTKVMAKIAEQGIYSTTYIPVEDHNWSYIRDVLHTSKVDLVKANTSLVATVSNSEEYNANLNGVRYACKHIDATGRFRLFAGLDSVVDHGVIGMTKSIKKKLTHKETLLFGQSGDVKAAIEGMINDGLIVEDESKGVEAWTEDEFVSGGDCPNWAKIIPSSVVALYGVDFCAIDVVQQSNGSVTVTNVTSCPSVQDSDVLSAVSPYFTELVTNGRKMTKEKLVEMIMGMSDDMVSDVGKMVKSLSSSSQQA